MPQGVVSVAGTYGYMPPERLRSGVAPASPASDLYGLGATLLFLLTGGQRTGSAGVLAKQCSWCWNEVGHELAGPYARCLWCHLVTGAWSCLHNA